MLAQRKPFWRRGMAAWQIIFCLALVSFLCRSMVPAGYMPDASGEHEGKFALTFCIAGGHAGIALPDAPVQPADAGPASGDNAGPLACPFGIAATQALIPAPHAPLVVAGVFHHPALPSRGNATLPPSPAQGPPLGSRAPPSYLG